MPKLITAIVIYGCGWPAWRISVCTNHHAFIASFAQTHSNQTVYFSPHGNLGSKCMVDVCTVYGVFTTVQLGL